MSAYMCVLGSSKNIWTSSPVAETKSSSTLFSVIDEKGPIFSSDYHAKYLEDARMFCLSSLPSVAQPGASESSRLCARTTFMSNEQPKKVWDTFDVRLRPFLSQTSFLDLPSFFLHTLNIDGQHMQDQKPYLGVPCVAQNPKPSTSCVGLLFGGSNRNCMVPCFLAFCFDQNIKYRPCMVRACSKFGEKLCSKAMVL